MPDVYYDAQAVGANDGSTKADAFQTEALARAATGAGDTIWSSHTSDEAGVGGFNITGAGQKFISVDFAGSTPPVAADVTPGAKLTGSIGSDTIFTGTSIFYDGFYFFVGDDLKPDKGRTIMDNCTIELEGINDSIFPGGGSLILNNPTFITGSPTTFINAAGAGGSVRWNGGVVVNPLDTLIQSFNLGCSDFEFNDADLSQVATLVTNSTLFKEQQTIFKGCTLKSGYVLSVGNFGDTSFAAVYGSHSSNIPYFIQEQDKYGGIITETTIVKTGGSSDGITPVSLKFVTSADAVEYILSLRNRLPILFYASEVGIQTFNVDVLTDGVTLQDDEAWLEASVPGVDIQRDISDSRPANPLAIPVDLPLSAAVWDTVSIAVPVKQRISIIVDIKQVGWVEAHICFARPSATMYADAKLFDSSNNQWLAGQAYINAAAVGGGRSRSGMVSNPGIKGAFR
jgi:hypothetical protein